MKNLAARAEALPAVACQKAYRVVVVRKNLSVEKGEHQLFEDVRYHFYITNLTAESSADIVLMANDRGQQENLIAQLKHGTHALKMPVGNLVGLYGDGGPGLEPQGLAGFGPARNPRPLAGTPPRPETPTPEHGVQDVPQYPDPCALSDPPHRPADGLPPLVLESLAGGVPATG